MGKKSRSVSPSNGAAAAPDPKAPKRSEPGYAPTPSTGAERTSDGDAGLSRFSRSFIGMLVLGGFAMMDMQALKEGFTVAAPDNKPLLAIVALFGWVVWKKWSRSGRRGLHPIVRAVGFMVVLAAGTSMLPFNSTVTMYEVPFLTPEECRVLVEAATTVATFPGFAPVRSRFDPATEVPLEDLPSEVSAMVSRALSERLMPFVGLEYGSQGTVTMEHGDFYVEHYAAHHETSPSTHLRPGQLSLRVELTPPDSKYVGGGGVVLGTMGQTVTPGLGSALVLPAKLRHGTSELGAGARSVLVGSMTVAGRDPWQRFVGAWRLWGLFTRSVRYIADKRLPSSGVATIPAAWESEPVEPGGGGGGGGEVEASPTDFGSREAEF